ncbi:MAG: phage protein gp10 family [Edaphobacter sp.]|nr:phage protein gp10 family [Edaphobacter sp.]
MAEDGFSISIEGLSDLQAKLDDLSTKAAERAIRAALRAGAAVEQAAIIERAPVKDGTGGMLPEGALKSDIVVKMTRDEQGTILAVVGPAKLTKHVARWVEYGHRNVRGGVSRLLRNGKSKGPGSQIGDVPAHPFIRPAYEASRQAVADTICTTLATEIEAASKRKGKS